jgi:hypothetical protein
MGRIYHAELWHDLYVMLGTSSAALLGLLFVATSLHLDEIAKNSLYRLRALNNSYMLIFTLIEATQRAAPLDRLRCWLHGRLNRPRRGGKEPIYASSPQGAKAEPLRAEASTGPLLTPFPAHEPNFRYWPSTEVPRCLLSAAVGLRADTVQAPPNRRE